MGELLLVIIIACSLAVGGCTNSGIENDTEPTTKVEESTESKEKEETDEEDSKEETEEVKEDADEEQMRPKRTGQCYGCPNYGEIEYEYGDGRGLCKTCYNTCNECNNKFDGDTAHIIQPGHSRVCDSCYNNYHRCDKCGKGIDNTDKAYEGSYGTYCEDCYNEVNSDNAGDLPADESHYCDLCGKYIDGETYRAYGNTACYECYCMMINTTEGVLD